MKGFLGGLVSIILVSAILFLAFYFFAPSTSIRLFGIAFNAEGVLDSTLQAAVDAAPISEETKASILSALDADAIDALLEAAGNNVDKLMDYLSSEEGQAMLDEAAAKAADGAESLSSYFSSDEVKAEISSI